MVLWQVAEKRKALLDELAIKYQTSADEHRAQFKALQAEHDAHAQRQADDIHELQVRSRHS